VRPAQLDDRRAGRPLLEDGELLLGGNTAASATLDGRIWDHLHKLIQAFQTSKSQLGQTGSRQRARGFATSFVPGAPVRLRKISEVVPDAKNY
jgi:hypothetical protein